MLTSADPTRDLELKCTVSIVLHWTGMTGPARSVDVDLAGKGVMLGKAALCSCD